MNRTFLLFLTFSAVFQTSCMTSWKMLRPRGEPTVTDRKTGQNCPKLFDSVKPAERTSTYGNPCSVEVHEELEPSF